MKHSEVLSRYVNSGKHIPEEQYERLTPVLKKSYLRMRGIIGYIGWEFKLLNDEEKIKYIETKDKNYNDYYIDDIIYYSTNKDIVATKIVEVKGDTLTYSKIAAVLKDSENTDEIATKIIEKKTGKLNDNDRIIQTIIHYSKNKDNIIIKIIQSKDMYFDQFNLLDLFYYSRDSELIKKTLLQQGVNYELINKVIRDNYLNIPLIPNNYQSMLNEIRRIKEIII